MVGLTYWSWRWAWPAELAASAATWLASAFLATFADLMDVSLAIAFTRRCLSYAIL
jgi:hypothetical protein